MFTFHLPGWRRRATRRRLAEIKAERINVAGPVPTGDRMAPAPVPTGIRLVSNAPRR